MRRTCKPPLPTRTLEFARESRTHPTDAEAALWYHLRAGRFLGLKWRRQHPVPPYIVDFCCPSLRLVVELDGSQHSPSADSRRTRSLQSQGFLVVRYWCHLVLLERDSVLEDLRSHCLRRTLSPTPLPMGEGLQEQEPDD
jgi:very-short-patch-repair endonuclease